MDTLECIKTRRSIRKYSDRPVENEKINLIIESAILTPSGKNLQPWKFKVLTDKDLITKIASLSVHRNWMKNVPCMVVVFLDMTRSYDYIKDVQSCGAAIQSMLLSAHAAGLGSCWVGEILSRKNEVNDILELDSKNLDLMGIVVLGYSQDKGADSKRNNIETFLL